MADHHNKKLHALSFAVCLSLAASSFAQAQPFPGAAVSTAPPAHPFFAAVDMTGTTTKAALGPATPMFVITNIIAINTSSQGQSVFLSQDESKNGACEKATALAGSTIGFNIFVAAGQTVSIPFPSGLVLKGAKHNCLGTQIFQTLTDGSVQVAVNGYSP